MSGDIIVQNHNSVFYAYHKGRFWRWDDARNVWKESHLMAAKFERARAALKTLTPEVFFSDGAEFALLDEYEIPLDMAEALKNAKPCKNAPIEPVKEDPTCKPAPNADAAAITAERAAPNATAEMQTTSESAADASASAPAASPQTCESAPGASADDSFPATSAAMGSTPTVFDFSALGDLSGQAAEADHQFDLHYGTAQDEYLISCIYVAKMHALTAKAGRYGGGTWTKWYESKGLSEGSARTMTQNGDAFKSATVADLKLLPSISRKDLNLIARSGCAEQLTAAAGDSQRVQELLAQIKAEKERADTAEAQRDAAQADVAGLHEQNAKLQQSYHDADESRIAANLQRQKAEAERDRAEARAKDAENQLAGSRQVAEAAKLRADKLQAENTALRKQPITAVVDEEEVDRRAGEKAYEIAAGMTADYKVQQEQDARDAYDSILMAGRSMLNTWQIAKPSLRKLPPEQREAAANQIIRTLGQIQGEVSTCL